MKILDSETTNYLLNRYVDYNNSRMDRPFSQELTIGKYLCATDGFMIVLFPETENNKIENDTYFKPVDINKIIPKVFSNDIEVDFDSILKLYSEVNIVKQEIINECESCEGDKKFEHFGEWYECKRCNETGVMKTGSFEDVKNPNSVFVFKEHHMSIKRIEKVIYIYKSILPEKVKIIELTPHLIWFDMDGVRIAVAGFMPDKDDKKLIFINAIN